ncbi:hypothetical protein [Thiobacillus denitrificans]|jgi:hypothetical protein|uniref:hypothetical protein n=1 Tax=Thiobacillus denitrificans TaxID=36861 RepID=UPI000377C7D3|nr:hypothetical protein [Thiobacillus denitrificans]
MRNTANRYSAPSDSIEFHICRLATEIHGFVNLVPMADAGIVLLQQEDYVCMR